MQSTRLVPPLLAVFALTALGCSEDVGSCDDPVEARDTVLVNKSSVQYAGQAIMNQSCANGGCHNSAASGGARSGAPKHLNFDLRPAKSSGEEENEAGEKIAKVEQGDLDGLRRRQKRVVEQRDIIWEQVKEDLMPPDGMFAALRVLTKLIDTDEDDVCAGGDEFQPITTAESKAVLRNWLACGAPIVETNTELVQKRTAGTVGYQYPMCGSGEIDISSIDGVQAIFDMHCTGCHPGTGEADLSDAETSYATLVEDDSEACDKTGKPLVTPGDIEQSYLYDLVAKANPGCHERMPYNTDPLSSAEIQAIGDWIEAGAKR